MIPARLRWFTHEKHKNLACAFCGCAYVGIVGSALALQKPESNLVEIAQNRKSLCRLDLLEYKDTESMEIAYGGSRNTVLIENGQICMSQADCPDRTCVKMGWLKSSAPPVVCLPHHLAIQYVESSDAVDGIAKLYTVRGKEK